MTALVSDQVLYGLCLECGRSHQRENRLRLIRPMVGVLTPTEIRAVWSCFYPPGHKKDSTARLLCRDIAIIRARERSDSAGRVSLHGQANQALFAAPA